MVIAATCTILAQHGCKYKVGEKVHWHTMFLQGVVTCLCSELLISRPGNTGTLRVLND